MIITMKKLIIIYVLLLYGCKDKTNINKDTVKEKSMVIVERESFKKSYKKNSNNIKTSEFIKLTENTLNQIPLKKMPSSNDTNDQIILSSKYISKIKNILEKRDDLKKYGIEFYRKCSNKDQYPNSIRAICLAYLAKLLKSSDKKIKIKNYPPRILELARSIYHF